MKRVRRAGQLSASGRKSAQLPSGALYVHFYVGGGLPDPEPEGAVANPLQFAVRRPDSSAPSRRTSRRGVPFATAADEDKRKLRIAGKRCVRHQRSRPAPIAFGHPGMPFEYRADELN